MKNFESKKNKVLFIAEIGGNHEGDFDYAKKLTSLAVDSGADAVKYQFYTADTLVSSVESPSRNEHFRKFSLENDQYIELMNFVSKSGALPMASIWSDAMLTWANPHISIHKVGSGDLTCYPLLKALAETNKPIILSTGLSDLREVAAAIEYIDRCNSSYITDRKLALLQCTSSYPTPDEDANINAMLTLKREFGLPVGYSDHTLGSEAIEVAVSMGAEIIEKHFTDNRDGKTFRDHLISLTRDEVIEVLRKIERIIKLCGDGNKRLMDSEAQAEHHISFRRSVYASCDIAVGEQFSESNLTVLRPAHGICASRFEDVLGKTAKRSLRRHDVVTEGDFG